MFYPIAHNGLPISCLFPAGNSKCDYDYEVCIEGKGENLEVVKCKDSPDSWQVIGHTVRPKVRLVAYTNVQSFAIPWYLLCMYYMTFMVSIIHITDHIMLIAPLPVKNDKKSCWTRRGESGIRVMECDEEEGEGKWADQQFEGVCMKKPHMIRPLADKKWCLTSGHEPRQEERTKVSGKHRCVGWV